MTYYTIVIPQCAKPLRTKWHPTEEDGVCTRGAFKTEWSAVLWADCHLNGTIYTVRAEQLSEEK